MSGLDEPRAWTEVVVAFTDPDPKRAAAQKAAVIPWLTDRGVPDFVETYIDGISDAADEGLEEALAVSDGDAYPLAFYSQDAAERAAIVRDLRAAFPEGLAIRERELPTSAWQKAWDETFTPFQAGPFRVELAASESPAAADPGVIAIAAAHAFGTGQHRATRILLRALAAFLAQDPKPLSLLDVGTGTGIVAILAAKMGVLEVVGTELSPDLCAVAAANARRNHVTLAVTAETDPARLGRVFPLVTANILAPVLHDLMAAFAQCVADGGHLFLSGFIQSDEAALVEKAGAYGFSLVGRWDEDAWSCLGFRKA